MTCEDLKEARAKRAANEKAKAAQGKGRRYRPRKNLTPETAADAAQLEEVVSSVPLSEFQPTRPLLPNSMLDRRPVHRFGYRE
jgi:hypothetical protein